MNKLKDLVYKIMHDYDIRAMFFVVNSLLVDIGFLLTYLVLLACNPSMQNWYGALIIYYLLLIIGYSLIFYNYHKRKDMDAKIRIKEEKKLFLPIGIIIIILALVIFVLTYLLYHYQIDTFLPFSLIIIHGGYVVVRVIVSLVLLIKKRKHKFTEHPLSFIAKHLSYIGILMSFVLATNAFRMINGAHKYWDSIIFMRGEFFGAVILGFGINFIIKGLKERKNL